MFNWIPGNAESLVVTANSNNFTLNQNAMSYFKECRYVLVGVQDNGDIAIKPVLKKDLELNSVSKDNLHKISVGKGYAKVNNKALMDYISQLFNVSLTGQKFLARYNSEESFLTFNIKKGLTEGGGNHV